MPKFKSIVFSFIFLLSSCIYYYYTTQNFYSGVLKFNKDILSTEVKIHTDKHGFFHIKANNSDDGTFGIGVVHAKERLWQMEMFRRFATGTLSEILGEKALTLDKMSRTIGFLRTAENDVIQIKKRKDHSEVLKKIDYYLEGVNYYAKNNYLPLEFYIVRCKYREWTLTDMFSFVRLFSFTMTLDHPNEALHQLIYDTLGQEYFDLLYNSAVTDYPLFNETIITKEEIEEMKLGANHPLNLSPDFKKISKPQMGIEASYERKEGIHIETPQPGASNSWVVHGSKTKSGKPIFNNDPHLGNSIPGIHTMFKLYIGPKEEEIYIGSAPPGIPYIIIGNNNHYAYGFTTDNRDISDFVAEQLDNNNITIAQHYFIDDKKYKLEIKNEVIKVKGKPNYNHIVKSTRNGPLIETYIKEFGITGLDYKFKPTKDSKANAISLKIFTFKKPFTFLFNDQLMYGKKKEDFLAHAEEYVGPSFALTWANINGEIGYSPVGHFPIKQNPVQVIAKGYESSSSTYSTDYIHRKDTPILTNPKSGFIVTANNNPLPSNYKYYSTHYSYHFRFYRIKKLLEEMTNKRKYDTKDAIKILGDTVDVYCQLIKPKIINILNRTINRSKIKLSNSVNALYEMIKKFDCNFTKTSKEATVWSVFEYKAFAHLLMKNEDNGISIGFSNEYSARSSMIYSTFNMFYDIIDKIEYKTLQLPTCKYFNKTHSCEEYLIDVLDHLPQFMIEGGFSNTRNNSVKNWSQVHSHYYSHPFEKVALLKPIFTRSNPTNGNRNTVKVSKNKFHLDNPFTSVHSANLKFMNDLADIRHPYVCLDTGNSGNILSKYYDNLMTQCEENKLIQISDHDFNDNTMTVIIEPSYKK